MKINIPFYWKNNIQRIQLSNIKWAKEILLLLVVILISASVFLLKPGAAGPDVTTYLNTGRRLLHGENYIPSPMSTDYGKSSIRAPFYSILFALAFRLFGVSISSALLLPKFATLGSIIIVYLMLRRIYDEKTGLATIALVATSYYMLTFPVSFNIDLIMAFFVLVSLFIIVLAFDKQSWALGIVAGTIMGMAVLVKELSFLWLPIIIYLFFSIPTWRNKKNFSVVIGYIWGCAAAAGSWWLIYYIQTGSIFLIDSVPSSATKIIKIAMNFTVVLILILFLAYRSRKKITHQPWFQSILLLTPRYSFVIGWFIWIVITILLTIVLSFKTSYRFDLHPDIFQRITSFINYVKFFVLTDHPLFRYLPAASAITVISAILKKKPGDNVLLWTLLSSMPIILIAYMPNLYVMPTRYLFLVYWLAYMILGRGLIVALDVISALIMYIISNFTKTQLTNVHLTGLFLIVLLPYSWQTSRTITSSYIYKLRSTDNYIGDDVVKVSQWLNEHVSPGSNIVAANAFHSGYRFFTDDKFNFFRWESFNESLGDTKWAVESQVSLERNLRDIQLLSKRDNAYKLPIPNPLYIEYGWDFKEIFEEDGSDNDEISMQVGSAPRFFTISEESLVDYLNRYEIDYIILPESSYSHHRFYEKIPSYFNDSPAFEHIFISQWNEGKETYAIHVYKVNRESLAVINYPITVPVTTWTSLENRAKVLMDDEYDVFMLNQALGGGPIIINGSPQITSAIYNEIAAAYLDHNEVEIAVFEYHMALKTLSPVTEDMQNLVKHLSHQYPDYSATWLLAGDVYYHQGDMDLAQNAYEHAIVAPYGDRYILSVTNAMLGKIHIARGQYSTAVAYLNTAVDHEYFGAEEIRHDLLFAQANIDLLNGNSIKALQLFQEYFIGNSSQPGSSQISVFYDFIKLFTQAEVSENSNVYPTVFFMDNNIQLELFAHPSSEISYQLGLPANAYLHFAPVIAPEVWQFGRGDGVQFTIDLKTSDQKNYRIYDAYLDPKNLTSQRELDFEAIGLSHWADETVTITFTTGCGPNEDCRFDWAGWAEPRLMQPVAYQFIDHFSEAQIDLLGSETGQAQIVAQTINYDTRDILFQHPASQVAYSLSLPARSTLQFGLGVAPEAWEAESSDGVEYNLYVRTPDNPNRLYRVYQQFVDPKNNPEDRKWFEARVNLDKFGGQTVEIIFEALPGPAGNFDFDWGGWGTPVLIDETTPGELSNQTPGVVTTIPYVVYKTDE